MENFIYSLTLPDPESVPDPKPNVNGDEVTPNPTER